MVTIEILNSYKKNNCKLLLTFLTKKKTANYYFLNIFNALSDKTCRYIRHTVTVKKYIIKKIRQPISFCSTHLLFSYWLLNSFIRRDDTSSNRIMHGIQTSCLVDIYIYIYCFFNRHLVLYVFR